MSAAAKVPPVGIIGVILSFLLLRESSRKTASSFDLLGLLTSSIGLGCVLYVLGKGAGLTAISGIVFRVVGFITASTAGTGITPTPKDPGMQAAKATVASGATTSGSTRTNHLCFGCGAAGPGGWVAPNPDSVIIAQGSGINSVDVLNASGTVSLNYEFSGEIVE